MPNRLIIETIRTSPEIERLSDGAEAFFLRLTTVVEDYGRFDARGDVLRSAVYPIRRRMTTQRVLDRLAECVDAGIVSVYDVSDRPYLQVVNWSKYQRVRAQKSKFPAPSEGRPLTPDDIRGQLRANAGKRGQMPPYSNSNAKTNSSRARGAPKDQDRVSHEDPNPNISSKMREHINAARQATS